MTDLEKELLEALEEMYNTNWHGKGAGCRRSQNIAMTKARAAIAKAKGETK